jgi:kelch-like protein 2/3
MYSALNVSVTGKDYLIEALKYHLLKGEQKILFKTPRTKPRQPVGLPKVCSMFVRQIWQN